MLIAYALQQVHLLSQGDTDFPTSGSEDFSRNLAAVNALINHWETQEGIAWSELFSTETGTVSLDDPTYTLSATFKWPAGLLKVGGTPVNYQKPEAFFQSDTVGFSSPRYCITGAVGSKVLNIAPTPSTDWNSAVWRLPCYNFATVFSTGAELEPIQMSDPYFAIHGAIALVNIKRNPTLAGVHQQIANEKLKAMRIANEVLPFGALEEHYDQTYSGFGT